MSGDRDTITAVKSRHNDPMRVAQCFGLDKGLVRESRTRIKVFCPRGERTPSLSIRIAEDGNIAVHCFGGCGLDGDIFTLTAAVHRLHIEHDFPEVLRIAADLVGIALDGAGRPAAPIRPLPPPPPRKPDYPKPLSEEDFAALVAPLLHTGRLDSDEEVRARGPSAICADVMAYLKDRGLLNIARREGWAALPAPDCQGSWVRLLLDVFGVEKVARSGLVHTEGDDEKLARYPKSARIMLDGWEWGVDLRWFAHSSNRLVIPWRRSDGLVQTVQRRRLDSERASKYVFPRGRRPAWPYGIDRLAGVPASVPVAFTEGAFDAVCLSALAVAHGDAVLPLGVPGIGNWNGDAGARWGQLAAGRVALVAFDNETEQKQAEDVEAAARRAADDLARGGAVRVERRRPEGAHDWADRWLQHVPEAT